MAKKATAAAARRGPVSKGDVVDFQPLDARAHAGDGDSAAQEVVDRANKTHAPLHVKQVETFAYSGLKLHLSDGRELRFMTSGGESNAENQQRRDVAVQVFKEMFSV